MKQRWILMMTAWLMALCPATAKEPQAVQGLQMVTINLTGGNGEGRLIVFPADAANNCGRAVVLCPGGGYARLSMENEGYNWVPFFHEMGYTAVVLKYQMPKGNPLFPIGDAEEAMRLMRKRADEWGLKEVGIMGFSAGGHLASTITVSNDSLTRPDFSILFYPVVTMSQQFMHRRSHNELLGEDASEETNRQYSAELHVTENTPPVFLALSSDDRTVFPLNSTRLYEALLQKNRPASLHVYPSGRHGWGFRDSFPYHEQMLNELKQWLKQL